MRSPPADFFLITLLRQCYRSSSCQAGTRQLLNHPQKRALSASSSRHRGYDDKALNDSRALSKSASGIDRGGFIGAQPSTSTSTNAHEGPSLENIAVLGGGITGLSTAYYLGKEFPNSNITIYESTERLGGWLRTNRVNVGTGDVIFEQGPRSLRTSTPAASVTMAMALELGLEDDIITTSKTSDAARNRYVYWPDHLVKVVGPGQSPWNIGASLLTNPLYKDIVYGIFHDALAPKRTAELEDESVGSFLMRRTGSRHPGDNLVSAVLHGIYAGDIYKLSAKSILSTTWDLERDYGSISAGLWEGMKRQSSIYNLKDLLMLKGLLKDLSSTKSKPVPLHLKDASVYSFRNGIEQLATALITAIEGNPNIKIKMDTAIRKISYDKKSSTVEISTNKNHPVARYNKVISTISGSTLSKLANSSDSSRAPNGLLPALSMTHSVTVMVVNLYYTTSNALPVHGFGYLIPRSIPFEQNPEYALGVVFDSDASIGQDTAPGTKVTVMLGGHWWDGFDSYPDEEEAAAMAKSVLRRHLNIQEEPAYVHAGLQKECIPQYTVGHTARMVLAHSELKIPFNGQLAVAGNSYTGVGLNDCVRSARDVVKSIKNNPGFAGITGLESFLEESVYATTRTIGKEMIVTVMTKRS